MFSPSPSPGTPGEGRGEGFSPNTPPIFACITNVMRRLSAILLLLTCAPAFSAPIDFDRDIRPIFSEHCYECHGTDKAKAGLRLNDPKIALSEFKSGARAIIPNSPKNSELIRRIKSIDPNEYMPPKGDRLTQNQIEKLQQ